jgi:hypothetical protein
MWQDGQIVAWIGGIVCALAIIASKRVREGGIGPYTTKALTICLGIPFIFSIAAQKILTGETVAALAGALLGIGIQSKGSDQK